MTFLWRRQKLGVVAALVCGSGWLLGPTAGSGAEKPPVAEKKPVVDDYHGTKVTDDYQWLEKTDDPAVKAWVAGENKATRNYLDALPDRKAIAARLTELYDKVTPNYTSLASRPGRLFALKFQPPEQQPVLVVMPSANEPDDARTVLDPNALEPKGKVAIDWYVPSTSGKLVAVSLSKNGSEDGTLYFFRTDTGEQLPDTVPRVQYPTAGGSAAWNDDSGVWYTRYPDPGEHSGADAHFYQQIYFHALGTDAEKDHYDCGEGFPRIAEITLEGAPGDGDIVATVADGDGGDFSHYVLDRSISRPIPNAFHAAVINAAVVNQPIFRTDATMTKREDWPQLTRCEDKVKIVRVTPGGDIYLLSVKEAPHGKVLRLPAYYGGDLPKLAEAQVVVPEDPAATIENITLTEKYLYVTDLVGGPSRVRRFDLDGKNGVEMPLPPVSSVGQTVALQGARDQGILVRQTGYTTPYKWLWHDDKANGNELRETWLAGTSPTDFSDIEAVREFAVSKDGTKVPLNILKKKGTKLDGSNPTLLYGYGGYSISMTPNFVFSRRLWFDRGGVYVVANLRGGGENGEDWHQGGNLLNKQNVFDDFAAVAEFLIKTGYTNPQKLAVEGGSNGGLLMGAFLTQHPDLARAVVSHVGIYDMLRVELDPNGAFNVTEFGTVKDPAQFRALYAYSPYHHVVDGTQYPAVLFMTGDNDGRVNPLHSRKMTARLQAANGSAHPILLRTTANAGHGMGTALGERIEQEADGFAFLFDQLGMKEEGEERIAGR